MRLGLLVFAHAMRNEVDDIETSDTLLMKVIHGMGIFFTENCHQDIGAGDFFFAVRCRLHVHDRALYHPLETQGRLRVDLAGTRHGWRVVVNEVGQRLAKVVNIDGASSEHFGCGRIIQQREQQMLNGNELMPSLSRLDKSHVQTNFEFLSNHASSITHWSGCPAFRAWVNTSSTFVLAISLGYTPHMPLPSRCTFNIIWVAVSLSLLKYS